MTNQDRFMVRASLALNVLMVFAFIFMYVKVSPFLEMKDDIKQGVETVKETGNSVNELVDKANLAADAVGEDYRRVRDTAAGIGGRVRSLFPGGEPDSDTSEEDAPNSRSGD